MARTTFFATFLRNCWELVVNLTRIKFDGRIGAFLRFRRHFTHRFEEETLDDVLAVDHVAEDKDGRDDGEEDQRAVAQVLRVHAGVSLGFERHIYGMFEGMIRRYGEN